MSRNLCQTECDFCKGEVLLEELPRPITKYEAHRYFGEFEGMLVANAKCVDCLAKYLAWVDETTRIKNEWREYYRKGDPFHDLSFRSTFNDEPGEDDLPKYNIGRIRLGPYSAT